MGGRLVGQRRLILRRGHPVSVTIPLHRIHSRRLWLGLRLQRGARLLSTVIRLRWR